MIHKLQLIRGGLYDLPPGAPKPKPKGLHELLDRCYPPPPPRIVFVHDPVLWAAKKARTS